MSRNKLILLMILAVVIYNLYFAQRVSIPIFNPQPVMSINSSRVIETVYELPFKASYVYEKLGPDLLKREFPYKKEQLLFSYNKSDIYMTLFYDTNQAAKHYYSMMKNAAPIYRNYQSGTDQYYITYLKQSRADQYGLFLPIQSYSCTAGFLKQNLVIIFSANLSSRQDKALTEAIEHVGAVLKDR